MPHASRLRGLVADGVLERLGHGLYRKTDSPPADLDRIEIALRAWDATLCLTSALSHHDLTDVIPSEIDVALPRSQRPPRVRPPVRWHRFHEDTFVVGRETIEVDEGLSIGIYSPERSIIDAFRLRHQEGDDLAVEALKRWLKRPGATPANLLAMARSFSKASPRYCTRSGSSREAEAHPLRSRGVALSRAPASRSGTEENHRRVAPALRPGKLPPTSRTLTTR